MMITRILPLAALAVLALAAGCSDPVASTFQPYPGVNGLVIDRITFILPNTSTQTYDNLRMDFGKSSVEFMDALGIQRAIRLEDHLLERRQVSISLPLPANAAGPGTYVWVDGASPTTTEAYMILDRDDVQFTSVRGATTITVFGPVGGTIEGTFNGVIRNAETLVESKVDGKFKAIRVN
jgi:hypothetical protein